MIWLLVYLVGVPVIHIVALNVMVYQADSPEGADWFGCVAAGLLWPVVVLTALVLGSFWLVTLPGRLLRGDRR